MIGSVAVEVTTSTSARSRYLDRYNGSASQINLLLPDTAARVAAHGEFLTVECAGRQAGAMSVPVTVPKKKLPIAKLVIGGVVLVVIGVLIMRGVEIGPLIDRIMGIVREAGPFVFFAAMALLPAIGAPLSVFALTSGEAFAPLMTMPGVIVTAFAMIAVNLALSYWLARYALRPPLGRLVARYGYAVPRMTPDNALSIILIVRFSGTPFFVQNYVLGLAEAPFRLYMIVSLLANVPFVVAFIVLGKAFRDGNFGKIATGIGVLVAAVVAVQVLRRKFAKREN
jgi:uncharacterized membrane protein YdjX (TVP38/TMEM64 family)